MQFSGVAIGLATLLLIGFGHAWVKWLLRRLGARTAPFVAALGLMLIGASLFINDWFVSALLGIAGLRQCGARKRLCSIKPSSSIKKPGFLWKPGFVY